MIKDTLTFIVIIIVSISLMILVFNIGKDSFYNQYVREPTLECQKLPKYREDYTDDDCNTIIKFEKIINSKMDK